MRPQGRAFLLAEAAWLALVLTLPAAFNPWGALAFEPTKAGLLRWLAVVMLFAWAAGRLDGWGRQPLFRGPILGAAALYLAILFVSTIFSVTPLTSLLGSYDRGGGLLTMTAGFGVAVVAADLFADPRRRERALGAVALGGMVPALYAVVQYGGLDPLGWVGVVGISSTLGSPTPLGGYLAALSPLALYAAVTWARALTASASVSLGVVVAYGAGLGVAVLAPLVVILASIRGPFLGLAAGLAAQGVASAVGRRSATGNPFGRQRVAATLALLILGAAVLMAGLAALDVPLISRFAEVANPAGSGAERLVVWRAAAFLPLADPLRLVFGFGPEAQAAALEGAEAVVQLGQRARWDRAHNVLLDAWLTTGFAGTIAVSGLVSAVAWKAWSYARAPRATPGERALAAALLGSLSAHIIEVMFGFQSVTTGTLFWVVVGVTASLGAPRGFPDRRETSRARGKLIFGVVGLGLVMALVALSPALADAVHGAALAARRESRPTEAAWLADTAGRLSPGAEEPPRVAGLILQGQAVAERDPGRAEVLFAAAEERLRRAIDRDPFDPFARLRLVRHYLVRADRAAPPGAPSLVELAESSCQDGLLAGPYRLDLWETCADVSARRGAHEEAAMRRSTAERLRSSHG